MITYPLNNIEYTAEDAELFHCTRTSGIFSDDDFSCTVNDDGEIEIGIGIGWIRNSRFSGKVVANKEPVTLAPALADPMLPRTDAVVIQFDAAANETRIIYKQGTAGATPTPPTVERSESFYELHLYRVSRGVADSGVEASDIIDLRANVDFCGFMQDSANVGNDNSIMSLSPVDSDTFMKFELFRAVSELDVDSVGYFRMVFSEDFGYGAGFVFGRICKTINGGDEYSDIRMSVVDEYGTSDLRVAFDGEWGDFRFDNPPVKVGVEYRTNRRFIGKPVYTRLVDIGYGFSYDVSELNIETVVDFSAYSSVSNKPAANYTNEYKWTATASKISHNDSSLPPALAHFFALIKYTKTTD